MDITFASQKPKPQTKMDHSKQYLTFIAHEDDCKFFFSKGGIECSVDGGKTWRSLEANETVSANLGDRVMWRGVCEPTSRGGVGTFSATNTFTAEGNAMSLLFGDDFVGKTSLEWKDYAFRSMFCGNKKLVHARNLCLPAMTLANSCYSAMFYNCTSLTTAPQLPAKTLAVACYNGMFNGCKSLTAAPQLLATTLDECCYEGMFLDCTSLATAPQLPATKLARGCYSYMFYGCTSLTTAPQLTATTLSAACYYGMFSGCKSLVHTQLVIFVNDYSFYDSMFIGCENIRQKPIFKKLK